VSEPPPVPTPPPRSVTKKGKPKKPKVERRGIGTVVFFVIVIAAVAAGGFQAYQSLTKSDEGAKVGDHFHAALGVDVCGFFVENPPEYHLKAGSNERAGVHSHGDGLIHLHPYTEGEAGESANVASFFENGGWEVAEDHLRLWEGTDVSDGQPCPDGRTANVRWAVNAEVMSGNPGDYVPEDGDIITIAFLPEGDDIPPPPSRDRLPNPVDEQPGSA
jgi:hypothetical protein